ncbi:probable serine/threonine-protein kinase At1g09600 [Impatiens glandulifera]|uniref:probable serine/threonine-protein kinase At1g09600 n=1 Tax=Impatiens glandulifera TaxID=253017 RepID=UPI001FB051B5|nr:probable serine/threonine-protein kinase At1g09600 [Impatiens glandulifera]
MGCLCSKGSNAIEYVANNENDKESYNISTQGFDPSKKGDRYDESVRAPIPITSTDRGSVKKGKNDDQKSGSVRGKSAFSYHKRRATSDLGAHGGKAVISRTTSIPRATEGEQIAAGWPSWLTSVAGEAIQGWIPRTAESFEKFDKIGQGTYSSVYKARDLNTGKTVAMKKVRFVNMDPESVRFMAREIYILRKLDHPNVMKLEGIVTSMGSGSLYLVFEYMDHDLAGLSTSPKIKFSESQIKCYMKQLFDGLEHCHNRGILHRDIKGSNLLIDNKGLLKIGDFGLANFYQSDPKQPLTSRVVTLWYRAPELLLGATDYGVSIDLWSAGCILAELFAGKPIMPGRTEVEQMHKIFKLCGSPSNDYWKKSKLPLATSFKPQHPYKRCVADTFKDFPPSSLSLIEVLLAIEPKERGTATSALNSEFFTTDPLPCDPSSLPKYPASKEYDAKLRDEEARKRRAEAKARGPESVRAGRDNKDLPTPEFVDVPGQASVQVQSKAKGINGKYNMKGDGSVDPSRGNGRNAITYSTSMVHPSVKTWTKKANDDEYKRIGLQRTTSSNNQSHLINGVVEYSNNHSRKDEQAYHPDSSGYVQKKRIHLSGPLVPPGGNMEDMLKEHERQIQEAVRKARLDKTKSTNE